MKRDMDLIRRILFEMEKQPFPIRNKIGLPIEGYSPDEITYHIVLLIEAGFILGYDVAGKRYPKRLTWEGHEFLDASRDEGRWKKAKKIVADKAGGISLEVIKQVLIQLMKDAVLGP